MWRRNDEGWGTKHMTVSVPHRTFAGVLGLLGMLACPGPAEALVVRHEDGSTGPGCGLVAHTESAQARARLAVRTPLPHSYVSASGRFRVHYTTNPADRAAVPTKDDSSDGIPDWVETTAHVADSAASVYEGLGYLINLSDGVAGGGPEYDIYLVDLGSSGVYGYTWPGDPHMQLDNDYADRIYETRNESGLRVTLAHELFHAVQFTYWDGSDAVWWQEATAVFMEDVLYPAIDDYVQYLVPQSGFVNTFFEDPSVPLHDNTPGEAHVYGAAVFCHFLNQSDPSHGHAAIRYTFERQRDARSGDRSVIVRAVETRMDDPIRDLLGTFWVWCYFSGSRTRPGLFFSDAAKYTHPPPSKVAADQWIIEELSTKKTVSATAGAVGLAARIFRFVPDGSVGGVRLTLSASGSPADTWGWIAAAADLDTVKLYRPQNGEIAVDSWDRASDLILVAANGALTSQVQQFSYTALYDKDLTGPVPEPLSLVLMPNRPNPFNVSTLIPFSLTAPAKVNVVVYDVTGRTVSRLRSSEPYGAGEHVLEWDGTTDLGRKAGTGVYLLRVSAGNITRSERMILLR